MIAQGAAHWLPVRLISQLWSKGTLSVCFDCALRHKTCDHADRSISPAESQYSDYILVAGILPVITHNLQIPACTTRKVIAIAPRF